MSFLFQVALKQCTSTVVLKCLFREIRVLRQLDHENVIRIYHTLVSTRGKSSNFVSFFELCMMLALLLSNTVILSTACASYGPK